jgi:hypothetical protein
MKPQATLKGKLDYIFMMSTAERYVREMASTGSPEY